METNYFYIASSGEYYITGFTKLNNYRTLKKAYVSLYDTPILDCFVICHQEDNNIFKEHFECENKAVRGMCDKKKIKKALDDYYSRKKHIVKEIPYFNIPLCGLQGCKRLCYREGLCSYHNPKSFYFTRYDYLGPIEIKELLEKMQIESDREKLAQLIEKHSNLHISKFSRKFHDIVPEIKVEDDTDKKIDNLCSEITGDDVNKLYRYGENWCPLLKIVILESTPANLKLLLEKGADPNIESIECFSSGFRSFYTIDVVLDLMREYNYKKIEDVNEFISLLCSYGIDLHLLSCDRLIKKNKECAELFYTRFLKTLDYIKDYIKIDVLTPIVFYYYVDERVWKKLMAL